MKMLPTRLAVVLLASVAALTSLTVSWAADPEGPATATAPTAVADAITHYRKARDLFDLGKYAEAQAEVNESLRLAPDLQDARLLASRIEAELAKQPGGAAPPTGGVGSVSAVKDNLLTPAQISRIRLLEYSEKDLATLRGNIPRKALDDFWTQVVLKDPTETATSQADHDRFVNPANFAEQVSKIRAARAVGFYDSVTITTDIAKMIEFRKSIQPFLIQNCATAACHGGADPHGYRIYGAGHTPSDRETYTNFYMLATYTTNGARMLDRDTPARSLLVQYGLASKSAVTPHPGGSRSPRSWWRMTTGTSTSSHGYGTWRFRRRTTGSPIRR